VSLKWPPFFVLPGVPPGVKHGGWCRPDKPVIGSRTMSDNTGIPPLRGFWVGAALAAAVVLQQLPAGAVTDEERSGARAAATEGAKAIKERRWSDAVDFFTRAESLVHSPVHLLFIARARANLGQLVEAREYYLKVTREQIAPDSPAAFLQAKQDAKTDLDALEPRLAYITVSVQGRSPNEVTVKMDGRVVPPALVGVPRPVNPGEHGFQAWAVGQESSVSKVSLKEGGRETVVLTLETKPAATAPAGAGAAQPADQPPGAGQDPGAEAAAGASAQPGAPEADTGGGDWKPTAAYASFGVGAVGLGAGIIFALQRSSKLSDGDDKFSEWNAECGDSSTSRSCRTDLQSQISDLDDQAASAGTWSAVGFVLGGLGVAAGVTLLVLSSTESDSPEAAGSQPTVTPWIGYKSVGITGTF